MYQVPSLNALFGDFLQLDIQLSHLHKLLQNWTMIWCTVLSDVSVKDPMQYPLCTNMLSSFETAVLSICSLSGKNTSPYYYGTHYSSAMIVASYLIRMEPFTQHFLKLQVCLFNCISICESIFFVYVYMVMRVYVYVSVDQTQLYW